MRKKETGRQPTTGSWHRCSGEPAAGVCVLVDALGIASPKNVARDSSASTAAHFASCGHRTPLVSYRTKVCMHS